MQNQPPSIVIGAGIVGICTALYLQEKGREVMLIDRLSPGEGTSSGNAGIISVGSVHPEAMPGIWKDIPSMLFKGQAPVSLRPAYLLQILPWFCSFLANSSVARAEKSSIAINGLSSRALEFLQPLVAKAGAQALLRQEGTIYVYETPAQLAKAKLRCAYYERRGVDYEILEGAALKAAEPSLRNGLAGGILVPAGGNTLSPLALSRSLFKLFEKQGGRFLQAQVTGFTTQDRRVTAVHAGTAHICHDAFITAGAYSKTLAVQLGSSVQLDTERGYHLQLPNPGIELNRPLLFSSRAFAVTSMSDGLRLAGTVEFAGLKAPANYARAHMMAEQAAYLFPQLNTQSGEPWLGYRPSLPDTVPVISSSPKFDNVFFGFGHGHLGLTQAAVTGAMLSSLATGDELPNSVVSSSTVPAPIPMQQFRIDRSF